MAEKNTKIAGVIDIGSSSIKLMIAQEAGGDFKIVESLKNSIPIGKDTFFKDRLSPETINQAISILEKYKQVIKEYEVAEVSIIATTAVREAFNRDIFVDTVLRKTGLTVDVLTAGDVVYYIDSYLSHHLKDAYPVHSKNLLIVELGAGSLDVSVMEKGFTLFNMGLPIGTLRLKQALGRLEGNREEIIEALREYIESEFAYLKRSMPKIAIDDVILIDETHASYVQNILSHKKWEPRFFQFSREDAAELGTRISDMTPEELTRAHKVPLEIADALNVYQVIIDAFLGMASNNYIYILQASLSEAVLANILLGYDLSPKYNKINQLVSITSFICRKYEVDINHAQQVALLSEKLFNHCKDILGLKKADLIYLILAAHLHDIGAFIFNRSHHKHSEYIVSSLNLFRLSTEEINMIACLSRYHRKAHPSDAHLVYRSLPKARQMLVQKLSAILRIANALDRSHRQKVKELEVIPGKGQELTLAVQAAANFVLEKADFHEKKGLFEEITGSRITLKVKAV